MKLKLISYKANYDHNWFNKYNVVEEPVNGFSRVMINRKWGLVNFGGLANFEEGEEVVEPKYDLVSNCDDSMNVITLLDGKYGRIVLESTKEQYEKRKEQGLCGVSECENRPVPGKTRCQKHLLV